MQSDIISIIIVIVEWGKLIFDYATALYTFNMFIYNLHIPDKQYIN